MSNETALQKRALRKQVSSVRASHDPFTRNAWSQQACAALLASPLWSAASHIALFRSMPEEVSTRTLIDAVWRSGHAVALPVTPPLGQPLQFRWVEPDTPLVRSSFGVLEPDASAPVAPVDTLELIVTPGLAFDAWGNRLGYGGGYYDRTLSRAAAPAIMLAFDCQRVRNVPAEAHDQRMAWMATESGLHRATTPEW